MRSACSRCGGLPRGRAATTADGRVLRHDAGKPKEQELNLRHGKEHQTPFISPSTRANESAATPPSRTGSHDERTSATPRARGGPSAQLPAAPASTHFLPGARPASPGRAGAHALPPRSPAPAPGVSRLPPAQRRLGVMEPRLVKPPGQDVVVERLKSRYGLGGGCPAEVRPRPRPRPRREGAGCGRRAWGDEFPVRRPRRRRLWRRWFMDGGTALLSAILNLSGVQKQFLWKAAYFEINPKLK